jgi:hypothetical protein
MNNLEEFISNNTFNVQFEVAREDINSNDRFDKYVKMFEDNIQFDNCSRPGAAPVYVYELKGQPVAWYDTEIMCGHIKR